MAIDLSMFKTPGQTLRMYDIEGLINQKNKSLDEQARLFALLEALLPEESEQPLG